MNKEILSSVEDQKAWENFKDIGFPTNKVEDYKYLDLSFLNTLNLYPANAFIDIDKDLLKDFILDENEFYNCIFVNGKFLKTFSNVPNSILVKGTKNNLAKNKALKNLNYAFNAEPLEFHFTKNLDKPVAFIHINASTNDNASVYTNYKIYLDNNVKAIIVDKFINYDDNDCFNDNVFDFDLSKKSYLEHYIMQKSEKNYQFNHYQIDLDENSTYRGFLINQKSKISRFDFEINLNKSFADAQLNGIYLGKDKQLFDHLIKTHHCFDNTYSSYYLKGIMKDSSKGIFYASTTAKKVVKKIEARQLNKNILLDKKASVFSRPELWIKTDDVKCSHGSTTGQLDKEAIYYLQSRGFSLEKAKKILLKAFSDEILEMINNENIKKQLEEIIL